MCGGGGGNGGGGVVVAATLGPQRCEMAAAAVVEAARGESNRRSKGVER
jgi:NAD(P)H-hydrate repair Nnr-like enzyme with NAD(P)H-hydrate epimerase domain